jgi:2-succinyl-6-hydroxy-2,4-cyclohexadiene-1-carboxylate synthase
LSPETLQVGPMHAEVWGDGRKPPLLLLHGICSSRAQWRPNLAALSKVATPVVVELLGHGRSQSPDDPAAYAALAYYDRFDALRAELGAATWAVCGQSFGAGLTMGYALAYPQRVSRQVFTNSASALRAVTAPMPTAEASAARVDAFVARGRAGLETMAYFPKRNGRLAPEIEDELVGDAEAMSLAGMARSMAYTAPGLSVEARLEQITTPTLLVNGRREKSFQDKRDEAARRIAGLKVVDLEGGHPVNLDCAEAFNVAVIAFLTA